MRGVRGGGGGGEGRGGGSGSPHNSAYLVASERKHVAVADKPVDAGDARRIRSGTDDLEARIPTLQARNEGLKTN